MGPEIGSDGCGEGVEGSEFGTVGEGVVADEAVEVGEGEDGFDGHAEFGPEKL